MLFSSPVFLFLFLPIVLTLYFIIPQKLKNFYLLIGSLFFYTWGERKYAIIMIISILFNYFIALLIGKYKDISKKNISKILLLTGILFNIGLLFFFKYLSFFVQNINSLLGSFDFQSIGVPDIRLPLGISFFTFHALSYIIDVYRGTTPPFKNIINSALYISFFPQLIAGPIIRYHDIAKQFITRHVTLENFSYGIQRFIIGLGKKVLIANVLASTADQIFSLPSHELSFALAWLGIICYSLQIYFDFSGYSDMAIGLARMFGFTFLENFNYPYIAKSITDFWRRWHISLSSWFRDYIYIPLGGNKKGTIRTCINLLIVFLLCGFWHGASWNFIIWGIWYGVILVTEKIFLSKILSKIPSILQHIYTLLIVIIGWVFFRSFDLISALHYLQVMFSFSNISSIDLNNYLNYKLIVTIIIGGIFSYPIFSRIRIQNNKFLILLQPIYICVLLGIFILSAMSLASGTYNPFIYFRF